MPQEQNGLELRKTFMSILHQFGIRRHEKTIGGPSTFDNIDGIIIIIIILFQYMVYYNLIIC